MSPARTTNAQPVAQPVSSDRAPWEEPGTDDDPRVRVNFSQLATGAWRCERTVEFPRLDLTDATSYRLLLSHLEKVDDAIREHMEALYEKDQRDRDEYFRRKEERDRNGWNR